MSYRDYESEQPEHECPTPLERPADEFDVGGLLWSPAGRWETITDRSSRDPYAFLVTVHTDKTGPDYGWTFFRSTKLPYLPSWQAGQRRYVVVHEAGSMIEVSVGLPHGFGHGHALASARMVRGKGWEISDRPSGGMDIETATAPSKAHARSEMNRRARAHAKRLGITVWRAES